MLGVSWGRPLHELTAAVAENRLDEETARKFEDLGLRRAARHTSD